MFTRLFSNYTAELQSLLFTAPAVLLAIICHECAHGWVSYKLSDPTAQNTGGLTLNPLKHLDPIGTLCMLFLYGLGKSGSNQLVVLQRQKERHYLWIACRPVTNFILAFISLFIGGLLMKFDSDSSPVIWACCQLCCYSAVVNIGLGLFNLTPIPPLDGSKVLGELWNKAANVYYRYQNYWRWILLLCVLTGILSTPLGMLMNC